DIVHGSGVKVDAVVGFPFGAEVTKIKAGQAREMVTAGADEIDMVADLAAVIDGDKQYLYNDMKAVLDVCRSVRPAVTMKVIIESAALTDEQIVFVCETASEVGADFVKTSTGLNAAGGASTEAVTLMKQNAAGCEVKAAGGVRTAAEAIAMIEAGTTRLGTSAGIAIIEEHKRDLGEVSEQ
ncbi:MAG: deoxyribose-phosphate aldolase, partial [Planctomycetes bacterium]|nr:deoxyribose-phosphate aldolase [Planctomycetota bacterium]